MFAPNEELPFAGHPTLGACGVWLACGGRTRGELIIQECRAGLIPLRCDDSRVAFAAPPMIRTGSVDDALVRRVASGLGIYMDDIRDSQWVDNRSEEHTSERQ